MRFFLALVFPLLVPFFVHAHQHAHLKKGAASIDSFTVGKNVHLLVTNMGAKKELHYIRSSDEGQTWSKPVVIPSGPIHATNRGYFPQVAAHGENITVMWTVPAKTQFGGGRLSTAYSTDGGKTWSKGAEPIDDKSVKEAAFLDLEADELGMVHAVWLDSRAKGPQGLRYARTKDFGKSWEKNLTINQKTCECCWNRIYATKEHLQTLYRAYDPRDMEISESKDSGQTWSSLSSTGAFGWKIKGCPHMGGSMARAGQNSSEPLYSFVWTGKQDKVGMYVVKSGDMGKTWEVPSQVGTRRANQGDIAATEKVVAMVWRDDKAEDEVLNLQYSNDGGKTWKPTEIFAEKEQRPSYPQIHASGDQFVVTFLKEDHGVTTWAAKTWRP